MISLFLLNMLLLLAGLSAPFTVGGNPAMDQHPGVGEGE